MVERTTWDGYISMVGIAIKMGNFKKRWLIKHGCVYYRMVKTITEDGHISMVTVAIKMVKLVKKWLKKNIVTHTIRWSI